MVKVSVIIPTYNCAVYLPAAIDSVLSQSLQDFEIIVVDDGSTDATADVVSKYSNQVRYLLQGHQGATAAQNTGLRNATGEYCVFLGADDLLMPGKLEIQASYLDQRPELGLVYSDGFLFRIDVRGREQRMLFSKCGFVDKHLPEPPGAAVRLLFHNGFPTNAAMVRRSAAETVGGFDPSLNLLEDWDLWFRIAEHYVFGYLEAIVAKYRVSDINSSHKRDRVRRVDEELKKKFHTSQTFANLPQHLQADYLYHWGMTALMISRPDLAGERFAEAARLNPGHLLARTAWVSTKLLGRNFATLVDVVYRTGRALKGDPFARSH